MGTGNFIGHFKDFSGKIKFLIKIKSHADGLGTLTGKEKSDFFQMRPPF